MIRALLVAVLIAPLAAFPQCPPSQISITDTAIHFLADTSSGVDMYCQSWPCVANPVMSYSIDVTAIGPASILYVGTIGATARVIVYDTSCWHILYDTCGIWVNGQMLVDAVLLPLSYRLVVIPDGAGVQAGVFVKIHANPTGRGLNSLICDTPLGTDFPTHLPTLYWRMDTGARDSIPLSPGLHIEQSGDRRRLILVR